MPSGVISNNVLRLPEFRPEYLDNHIIYYIICYIRVEKVKISSFLRTANCLLGEHWELWGRGGKVSRCMDLLIGLEVCWPPANPELDVKFSTLDQINKKVTLTV